MEKRNYIVKRLKTCLGDGGIPATDNLVHVKLSREKTKTKIFEM